MRRRPTRVAISTVTALAMAAATFAAVAISLSQRGHPGATVTPPVSSNATPSGTASAGPPVSPAACLLPVSQDIGTAATGVTGEQYGFLDTATGQLQIDPAAPTQAVGVVPGLSDLYVPSLEGWRSLPDGAVISPDGRSYAYLKSAQNPFPSPGATLPLVPVYGGQVHVVDEGGTDHALTPVGELDYLIGWADDGLLIARADQTSGSQEGVYLVNPTSGTERELAISSSPASLSFDEVVSGDTLWYAPTTSPGEPQTVVSYEIQTGASTTWFDTQGTPYSVLDVEAVDAQGDPVVWAQNGAATSGALLVLTQPDALSAAQVVWGGPLQQQGYDLMVTDVSAGPGWLWFAVEKYLALTSAGQTPVDMVLDATSEQLAALQPSGTGHIALPLGAGPLANGSTLTFYWWDAASGSHPVAQLPVTGENSISIVGGCIAG